MKKIRYIVNGKTYEIPENESAAFLKDFPDAKVYYNVGGQEYHIPHQEADAFETDMGLKKKEVAPSPSLDGKLSSQAVEIPKVDLGPSLPEENTPEGNRPGSGNPIDDALYYNELKNKTKQVSNGIGGSMSMGSGTTTTIPDEESVNYANKIKDELKDKGINVDEMAKDFSDFPQEAFNHPETNKERLADLSLKNPILYRQLINETKNQYAVKRGAKQRTDINPNYNAGNDYVGDNTQVSNLNEFYRIIDKKRNLINENLSGDERDKALLRLQQSYSNEINPTNPELIQEYDNSEFKSKLTPSQYAGLKTLQVFEPEKYEQFVGILNTPINKKYTFNMPTDAASNMQAPVAVNTQIETPDSALAAKMGGRLSSKTVDEQIGQEFALRQLGEIGAMNAKTSINKQQYDLDERFKNSNTPEEKAALQAKYIDNQNKIASIDAESAKDDEKYPLTAQMKFDKQVKEITQQYPLGILNYGVSRFAKGFGNTGNSIEDMAIGMFGSKSDNAALQRQRIGEQEYWNNYFYLPENLKSENSPFVIQPTKELKDEVNKILNGRSLSDLKPEEYNSVMSLIKNNQDKIQTITNPNADKSKNFFSKSTLYSNAGMIGDIASIAAQSYGLGGLGASKFIASAAPMFTTTYSDFYNEASEQGMNPVKAQQYATLHASIMAAAGLVNPDLDIAKRTLGLNTALGKTIAGVSEKTWQNVIEKNKTLLSKLKNAFESSAKEALKMTATYGVGTSIASDLADKAFFDKKISAGEILDRAVDNAKHTFYSSAALVGLNFLTHFKNASLADKSMFWELGANPEIGKLKIDEAVKNGDISPQEGETRKKLVDQVNGLISKVPYENGKGKPLTDIERVDYLYNLISKEKASDKSVDTTPNQKEKLEHSKLVSDFDNILIIEPKTQKQLESRKAELEKILEPKKDDNGKIIELPEKERLNASAELESVNKALKAKEADTKLSQPIEGLNEQGIPLGDNVPPPTEIKGEPEQISQPIELSVGEKDTPQYPNIRTSGNLRTFDFGDKEGTVQNEQTNKVIHNNILNKPDSPMYDSGESFNEAVNRTIPEIKNIIQNAKDGSVIVTHNSIFGLLKLWDENGRPDVFDKSLREKYIKQDNKFPTGSSFKIETPNGEITIVRHGETDDNVKKVFRTKNTELTQNGIEEAKKVGKELSGKEIPEIYSSSLPRAIHTSNIIMAEQGGGISKDVNKIVLDNIDKLPETYRNILKEEPTPENVDELLKHVSDQWHDEGSRSLVEKEFPKEIIDAAKEKYPQESDKGLSVNEDWSKDVESTAKALEGIRDDIKEWLHQFNVLDNYDLSETKIPDNIENQLFWQQKLVEKALVDNGVDFYKNGSKTSSSTYYNIRLKNGDSFNIRVADHDIKYGADANIQFDKNTTPKELLEKLKEKLPDGEILKNTSIADEYHKQKSYKYQTNPQLVKAVEDLLGKPKVNEEETQAEVPIQKGDEGGITGNEPITTEEGGLPTTNIPETVQPLTEEGKVTGVKRAITDPTRGSMALPKVEIPKMAADSELLQQAKERVDSGQTDPRELVNRILDKNEGYRNEDDVMDMQYYAHQLASKETELTDKLSKVNTPEERAKIIGDQQQLSDEIDRQTQAAQIAGNKWHRVGMAMQPVIDLGFNISRERNFIKEAYGGEITADVKSKIDAITKERDAAIAERTRVEELLRKKMAKEGFVKVAEEAKKQSKRKQVKEELIKEENELLNELKKAIKQDFGGKLHSGIPIPQATLEVIGKLAVNYFKQGINSLEAVVDKIYNNIKDEVDGISKFDIRDAIANYEPLEAAKETSRLEKKAQGIEDVVTPPILDNKGRPTQPKTKKERKTFETNTDWVKANQKVANAEFKMKVLKRKAFESQKNMYQKGLMWAGRAIRLSVLSGYNVLGKLAAAATIGSAVKRIPEQAIGKVYQIAFKGISEKAPIEGSINAQAEGKFYKEFFNPKKFVHNSWEILKTGASDLSKKHGGAEYEHIPVVYIPTDLHQIIKDPPKRATFEAAVVNGLAWAEKNGLDINDTLVRQSIETAAYKRAMYEIFQESNWLSRKFISYKNKMEKSGNTGATAKFITDFLIPVSTVPSNIIRRVITTSPLGLGRGFKEAFQAYRKGIESLKPEEADHVMQQLKQGSLGTALWLIGWFGASHFGGLYSKYNPDKKRKEGELASDEMEVDGKMIPKPVQHALPLEIIQFAATARHVYDNYRDNKDASIPEAIYNAGMSAIGAGLEQVPVIETGVHLVNAASNPYEAQKLKEDAMRRFEPQILRETGIIEKEPKPEKKGKKSDSSSRQRVISQ